MSDECEYAESIPAPKCPAATELAAERAAHLATRQELSMALADLAAEVERLRDLFAAEQKATHAALTRDADQIERLREALRSYGSHTPDCGDARGCTCGYSAALAGKEEP